MTAAYYDDPAFLYGNSARKYDEVPSTFDGNRLHWRLEVAWNSTFVYYSEADGTTEAVRATECYWNRGRPTLVNYDGNGLTRTPPGRMVFTLSNTDGRYDPLNSSSALYPNVSPGKYVRLGVRRASSAVYTWRLTGKIESIRPYTDPLSLERWVEIVCVDGWGSLQNAEVYLPVVQDTLSATIVANILEHIDWPDIWSYDAQSEALNLPYFWVGGKDARTVLFDVAESQGSFLWLNGSGKLYYRPSTDSPASVIALTQSDVLRDVPIDVPWNNAYNMARMTARRFYDSSDLLTAWGDLISQDPGTIIEDASIAPEYSIPSGGELVVSGRYTIPRNVIFGNDRVNFLFASQHTTSPPGVMVPYVNFRTAAGGAGTDVSGFVDIVSFLDGGDAFELKLKNNYSAIVYCHAVSIIGYYFVTIEAGDMEFSADNSASGAAYKTLRVDTPYLNFALDFDAANLKQIISNYLDHISQNRLPQLTLEGNPSKQFLDMYDHFTFASTKLGISTTSYRIGHIQERWLATPQAVQTVIQTEPFYSS